LISFSNLGICMFCLVSHSVCPWFLKDSRDLDDFSVSYIFSRNHTQNKGTDLGAAGSRIASSALRMGATGAHVERCRVQTHVCKNRPNVCASAPLLSASPPSRPSPLFPLTPSTHTVGRTLIGTSYTTTRLRGRTKRVRKLALLSLPLLAPKIGVKLAPLSLALFPLFTPPIRIRQVRARARSSVVPRE
jgi:hypothetical protein